MATTPSIAMIPSGYKDEKVYSVLPTNGDGDFTFARTSTATRVNSNGLIEEVAVNKPRLDYSDGACPSLLLEPTSTNLIQYSEAFGRSYWTKNGSSIQGDPSTAGTEQVTNGDFATDSDWTKGTGWSIGGGVASCDGTQTAYSVLKQSGAVPINTNYKLVFTATITSGNILPSVGGSNGQGAISTTGTYTFYTIASTGDNDLYFGASSDFVGTIDNVSVKEVQGFASPSGTTSAFKLVEDTSNGNHILYNAQDGSSKTFSFFAKSLGNQYVAISYDGGASFNFFDIINGQLGNIADPSHTSKIEDYGNGWFRCSLYNGSASFGATIWMSKDGINTSYAGNGTDGVYIYGAQLEQQSYATSYIKNEGTAAGITRAADTATGSGDATVINSTEGVFYAEISSFGNDGTTSKITLNDSSSNNHVAISYSNVTNTIRCILYNGSVFGEITTNAYDILSNHKIAYLYKSGDFKLYIDGSLVDTSNDAFTISGLNNLSFDNGSSTSKFNGKVKDVRVYTTALEGSELETLTTI